MVIHIFEKPYMSCDSGRPAHLWGALTHWCPMPCLTPFTKSMSASRCSSWSKTNT